MPITGSQKALMQCRSGIERCGASRTGYFTPNSAVTINGVDRSASVISTSIAVSLALNDEPDTLRFTLRPGATIPTAGQLVVYGLGTAANAIFAGQVARVSHRRRDQNQTPYVDVECIDWQALFDRRTICTEYPSQSASLIAASIVNDWTLGFTTVNIQAGLPTVDFMPVTNEAPSAALRRLVALMGGGGFYIDALRDVHVFGVAGETGYLAPTPPQTLTNSLGTLKAFTHTYDYSQVRNRIICEGFRTTVPIAVPLGSTDFPVGDATIFSFTGGRLRLGTQRLTYTEAIYISATGNPPTYQLDADITAGTTSINLPGALTFVKPGWMQIGEQYVRFTSQSGSSPTTLSGIPASGYGAITGDAPAGTLITILNSVKGIPATGFGAAILIDQPKDTDAVLFVQLDDTTSQTAIAAIEGGDGIHEHVITDGRLDEDGATARAQADLDAFKDPLLHVSFVTDDMNARPGAIQGVALTVTDALTATAMITKVDFTVQVPNRPPLRQCEASTVKLPRQLWDVAVGVN